MTSPQEAHLRRIKDRFETLCDHKYRKGQDEHGGDLFNMPQVALVDEAINEAIDQITYLVTLRDQLAGGFMP